MEDFIKNAVQNALCECGHPKDAHNGQLDEMLFPYFSVPGFCTDCEQITDGKGQREEEKTLVVAHLQYSHQLTEWQRKKREAPDAAGPEPEPPARPLNPHCKKYISIYKSAGYADETAVLGAKLRETMREQSAPKDGTVVIPPTALETLNEVKKRAEQTSVTWRNEETAPENQQSARLKYAGSLMIGTVLDVGTNSGFLLDHMDKWKVTEYIGLEGSRELAEKAGQHLQGLDIPGKVMNVDITNGDVFEQIGKQYEGHFQSAFMGEVLEHIPEGKRHGVLNVIRQMLKPDGMFILTTPKRLTVTVNPDHFDELSADELRALLEAAGFTVDGIQEMPQNAKRPERVILVADCRAATAVVQKTVSDTSQKSTLDVILEGIKSAPLTATTDGETPPVAPVEPLKTVEAQKVAQPAKARKFRVALVSNGGSVFRSFAKMPIMGAGLYNIVLMYHADIVSTKEFGYVPHYDKYNAAKASEITASAQTVLEGYDVLFVNLSGDDITLPAQIRQWIGYSSSTKLVVINDYSIELLQRILTGNQQAYRKYILDLMSADILVAQEPMELEMFQYHVQQMKALLKAERPAGDAGSDPPLPLVSMISHPINTTKVKTLALDVDKRIPWIGYMYHRWDGHTMLPSSLLKVHPPSWFNQATLNIECFGYVDAANILGGEDEYFDSVTKMLPWGRWAMKWNTMVVGADYYSVHSHSRLASESACMKIPMVSTTHSYNATVLFPDTTVPYEKLTAYRDAYHKLVSDEKFWQEQVERSYRKVEMFNYSNVSAQYAYVLEISHARSKTLKQQRRAALELAALQKEQAGE